MKTLLRQLTMHDYGLPSYSLITNVHYDIHSDKGNTIYIDSNDRRNLKIQLTDENGNLTVNLRPLRRALEVRNTTLGDEQSYDLQFSKEDILAFVEDVRDVNTIHRETPYVVPGLLILETLWHLYNEKRSLSRISVDFKGPTLAGDYVRLIESEKDRHIDGCVGDIVLFTAHINA